VREAAIHVVTSLEQVPALVGALRRGRDYMDVSPRIAEPVKRIATWWLARGMTSERLGHRFERAYEPVISLFTTIPEAEYALSGHAYGEGVWTVEYALRHLPAHIHEHVRQIRSVLTQPWTWS